MKKGLLFLVCILSLGGAFAQDFEKGGHYVSAGYVLDPFDGAVNAGHGLTANYEYGVTDILGIGRIGAGGSISTLFYSRKWNNVFNHNYHYKRFRISLSPRATYHFEFDITGLDVYAGIGGSIYIDLDDEVEGYTITGNPIVRKETKVRGAADAFAGIRYYFTDAIGVYSELGYGHRAFSIGAVFSL